MASVRFTEDASEIARSTHGFGLVQLVHFGLDVLRQQFVNRDGVVRRACRAHAFAQIRRELLARTVSPGQTAIPVPQAISSTHCFGKLLPRWKLAPRTQPRTRCQQATLLLMAARRLAKCREFSRRAFAQGHCRQMTRTMSAIGRKTHASRARC